MRFYAEPAFQYDQRHPYGYRLHAVGPGPYQGAVGLIEDAGLAMLIVDLLNARTQAEVKPE